ncbi:MAG: tetratricopeptide repeat protein [Bryobacteraceae bacterium]|nr:tetratricopeptide repeat protein [Bryobacteraceae bacterium]
MKISLLRYVLASLSLGLACAADASVPDYQLALRYTQQADWKNAETALDRVLQNSPGYMPAVLLKGRVLFSLGRYAESLKTTQQFLEQEPYSGEARKLAGLAYFMTGNQEGARSELQKASELSPRDADSFYYLGRVYFTASNLPLALSAFETAIKLDPGSIRARNHLGQTLEGLARFSEAKSAYLSAIKLEGAPKNGSEWPYHNLAVLMLQQGEAEEAIKYFREALARNPSLVISKVKLAVALSDLSKLAEARTVLEEALRLEPRSPEAHYQIARLLTKMRHPEEARKHFLIFQQIKTP